MDSLIGNISLMLMSWISKITLWDLKLWLIFTFCVWYLMKQICYYRKLPPGPWGMPYLGYLPFMRGSPDLWYLKKSAQYGDIFSLKLGNYLVVCIGSTKLLRDLFNRPDSTGRPHTPLNNLLGGMGIVLCEGTLWKKQRQFLHEKFRNLGVKLWPNQHFEKFILMEIEELFQNLEKSHGRPVDPAFILGRYMHNVICQLMMSFRFDENDDDYKMFNDRVIRGMKLYGSIHFGEYVKHYMVNINTPKFSDDPSVKASCGSSSDIHKMEVEAVDKIRSESVVGTLKLKLPGKQAVLQEIKRNLNDISKFHGDRLRNRMELRKETTESYEPADLLDHYLEKIETEDKLGKDATIFSDADPENQIVQVMNDLFSAGMENTRTAILWCLIMMLRYPEVAQNVREEINRTVQVGHIVTLEHRTSMPYVEGVIYETLRIASIVPLGTTHVNTSPWQIDDYTIPAGTHIIPLINKMNMDPEIYPEPDKFIPERFIRNCKFYASENFMPFGVGQRMCLGSQLARMELFLFFANIMNSFEFAMPDGQEVPGLEGVLRITHAPVDFDLCFKKLDVGTKCFPKYESSTKVCSVAGLNLTINAVLVIFSTMCEGIYLHNSGDTHKITMKFQ